MNKYPENDFQIQQVAQQDSQEPANPTAPAGGGQTAETPTQVTQTPQAGAGEGQGDTPAGGQIQNPAAAGGGQTAETPAQVTQTPQAGAGEGQGDTPADGQIQNPASAGGGQTPKAPTITTTPTAATTPPVGMNLWSSNQQNTTTDATQSTEGVQSNEYSNTATTSTNYGWDDIDANVGQTMDRVNENIIKPYQDNHNEYISKLNELMGKRPEKAPLLRDDLKTSGWVNFARAMSDLGRATGKASGNTGGFGRVKVDNTKEFDESLKRNQALKSAWNEAIHNDALQKMQDQISLLNADHQGKQKVADMSANAYMNALNSEKNNNNTRTTSGNGWQHTNGTQHTTGNSSSGQATYYDPKGKEVQLQSPRASSHSSGSKGEKKYKVKNPMFNATKVIDKYWSDEGKKTRDKEIIDMTKEQVDIIYSQLYPKGKAKNTYEKIKEIEKYNAIRKDKKSGKEIEDWTPYLNIITEVGDFYRTQID